MTTSSALLEIENLTIAFGPPDAPVVAVDQVGFAIRSGETVGLVGESGSGKSLTSLAVLRLTPPQARILGGRILFQGTDLLALPEAHMPAIRGRDVAMIFQEPMSSLNPLMTVASRSRNRSCCMTTRHRTKDDGARSTCFAASGYPIPQPVSGPIRISFPAECASA